MLTLRTSAQIAGNRHRLNFRLCPASTGVPEAGRSVMPLRMERRRLRNAELRRLWLEMQWRAHLGRVRRMHV